MSSLRLIKETTASSVSSVDVTDVFSADFNTYQITAVGDFTDANSTINARFINTLGSTIVSSKYDNAVLSMEDNYTTNEDRAQNETSLQRMIYSHSGNDFSFTLYIFNPYSSSSYTTALWQGEGITTGGSTTTKGIGSLKEYASITGIQFFDVTLEM
jgi:hypothetical protein